MIRAIASFSIACCCLLAGAVFLGDAREAVGQQPLAARISKISPGPDVQYELQSRLIDALPGDVIQFEAGTYRLRRQLDIATSNLTLRGAGSGKTILSFKDQDAGGAGIEATGDNFVIEGLAVEDTDGNAIKVLGAEGVTLRDVRAQWTGPPLASNGAYGLYPVQCNNVLIEQCTAIGASDAGIYVGQCRKAIVRHCRAERNVAGVEIENTIDADVYDNVATNNTGGILVFDLPGLQISAGRRVRVYNNKVIGNNHPNFAAKGNIVADVPPGTGVMVMATDDVEVFDNEIRDHRTGSVAVLSYRAKKRKNDDAFDPYPESISIHDNRIANSGYDPGGAFGAMLGPLLGGTLPDILWDGVVDAKNMIDGKLSPQQIPSIVRNGDVSFVNFDYSHLNPKDMVAGRFQIERDLSIHDLSRESLPPVELDTPKAAKPAAMDAVLAYRSAKQRLSQYGLFVGNLADHEPAADVVRYELNMQLFSDYTTKRRFIRVPKGIPMEFRDQGVFDFPVGTVISKTFSYPRDMTDPAKGEQLLETRIELRGEKNWYGFSYLWNTDQSDAVLALGGSELNVHWIHSDGTRRSNHYQVPNANQCLNCHQKGDRFVPLGPVAANLNRDHDLGHGPQNQLEYFRNREVLDGLPALDEVAAWPSMDESIHAGVEDRARTWLHVNCAHCHSPDGTARTSGLDLRLSQTDRGKLGVWKPPVAAGHGSGGRSYDIVPGKPDESILMYRIESADPSIAMPSVAKRLVPLEAAALVRRWITEMEP